ncbi:MAG: lamin tail domain-containing protein [Verrucomicrobiales bacterium]
MRPPLVLCAGLAALLAGHPSAAQINPADYGNITLHLKADALALANQQAVASWGPLTAAGTTQPTYIASDSRFNNQPVVRFDGTDDLMIWSTANLNARTIFLVVTLESNARNLATLISNGSDGLDIRRNNTTNFYRSPGQGMDGNDFVGNAPTGTLSVNNVASGAYTAGNAHIVVAVAGGLKNYSTFWLGNARSTLTRWWTGSVAEVIVYDNALTPRGIDRVGYHLQSKYSLPTTFPPPTPTVRSFAVTAAGISSEEGVLSTPGSNVTLAWTVENAASVSIDNGALASSPDAIGSVTVNQTATTAYTITATNSFGSSTKTVTVHIGVTPQPIRLNEFLAENDGGLEDVDGDRSEWIEIYNPNPFALDLQGYRLRDSVDQWDFPARSAIPANGYRYVFASGKNWTNPAVDLHTNFSLENSGENLALVRIADNAVISEFASYPQQFADTSYGYWGDPLQIGYFGKPMGAPTPGAANSEIGVIGFLDRSDDTDFTADRGFYTTAVTMTISATTPGARIIYTTNGSEPTETNGTQVNPPDGASPPTVTMTIHPGAVPDGSTGVNIPSIGGVTTLRAAAFKAGYAPTNIDTQTYIFPVQVLGQTVADATAKGWPAAAVNGQLFNYGMDPNVVSSFPQAEMLESLQSIPTLSFVTDSKNLVDSATGIYVNADQHGSAWERATSIELIHPPGYVDPDGNPKGFQIDGGLRIRGGYSRNDQFYKHGFRLFFSDKYDGQLKFRMFGNEGTDEFGKLDLGTSSNYAWFRESSYGNGRFNTMCRDMFCRDTQGALGQPYTKSRFYHLLVNGHYWGVYYSEERAEAEFGASYMGGDADEYDAVKCGNHIGGFATEATDGTLANWQTLWNKTRSIGTAGDPTNAKYFEIQGRNPDGTRNAALPVLLDVDNLVDEMLTIFYSGDGDAVLSNFLGHDRPNNWFSVYRRSGDLGFRFFIRDAEHTLGSPSSVVDQTGPWGGQYVNDFTYSNPQRVHQDLMASAEYKLRFADHVQQHFFNEGALTPAKCIARFDRRARQVEKAMKAESARWGDAQSISGLPAGHPPRYIVADWQAAVDFVKNSIMPGRTQTVLNQLIADGLYPGANGVAPASFLNDATGTPQRGGNVPAGFRVRLTAPAGTIYYTLDGSDPRAPSGSATGTEYSVPIEINGATAVKARVLSNNQWSPLEVGFFTVDTVPATAANLVVSQIDYNPGGNEFEFLELMNISTGNIDLTGVHLRDAVDFDFPDNTILAAGARLQVVGDLAAFATRYGAGVPLRPIGPFVGNLSNGGEHILIVSDGQGTLKDFTYDDDLPWPLEADGQGYRFVLIQPLANPDHGLASNWRGSMIIGAAPGHSDAVSFSGDPAADADQDGFSAFLEYALGTSDANGNAALGTLTANVQAVMTPEGERDYLTLTLIRSPIADDAAYLVEVSNNLSGWLSGPDNVVLVSRNRVFADASGPVIETWRSSTPFADNQREYLRLRVDQR